MVLANLRLESCMRLRSIFRARTAVVVAGAILVSAPVSAGVGSATASSEVANVANTQSRAVSRSAYESRILADRPVAFLQRRNSVVGPGRNGVVVGKPKRTRLPNGDPALAFNGRGQFLRFHNRPGFRIPTKGVLTVEYWMRPDTLQFANEEGSGYVYVLGKGRPSEHEWYGRMYSKRNSEDRPNRISGYAFNPEGGLGAGSYFEEPVRTGRWIHVVLVVNTRARSSAYPTGYTKIYRNGVLRDQDSLKEYNIVCRAGKAPLRLGTGYRDSYFRGAIGNVAFYDRELSSARVISHFRSM